MKNPVSDYQSAQQYNVRTVCRFCLARCPVTLTISNGRITGITNDDDIFCEKGKAIPEIIHARDRITQPMISKGGEWCSVSWQTALDMTAKVIEKLINAYGAQSLHVHLGQSQVLHLLSREFAASFCNAVGTANLSSSGSQCNVCRAMGNQYTCGYTSFPDYSASKCIIIWGANPENTNAFNLRSIRNAVRRGAKLIVVDPRGTQLARNADIHLQLNPGTDRILALAIISVIINQGLYDSEYIEKWTHGFDLLKEVINCFTLEQAESITGVGADLIREAAKMYCLNHPASLLTGNSLEHHIDGFQAVRATAILLAIGGNLEIPGGNVINKNAGRRQSALIDSPVQSHAMGRTRFPLFYQATGEAQANLLAESILYSKPYPTKGLIVIGGNPAISFPDTDKFGTALDKLEMLVVMDQFMTATARRAHILLPATTTFERFDLCNLSPLRMETRIALIPPAIEPQGEAWPEWRFWQELGRKMGIAPLSGDIPDKELMAAQAVHFGLKPDDLAQYPQQNTIGTVKYYGYLQNGFPTDSGKIELYSETLFKHGYDPIPSSYSQPEKDGLLLVTGSKMRQFMISRYRTIASLCKRQPYAYAEISPHTAEKYGVISGEVIVVTSCEGKLKIQAKINPAIKDGVVYIPVGWEETDVNILNCDTRLDPVTGFPIYKSERCTISGLK